MNKQQKIKFIKSLLKEINKTMLKNIDIIPNNFDEVELKELIILITKKYSNFHKTGISKNSKRYKIFKYFATYKFWY